MEDSYRQRDAAKQFFLSKPSISMKNGKIDLDCVRLHILHSIAALWCLENDMGIYIDFDFPQEFYSVLSDVAHALSDDKAKKTASLTQLFLMDHFLPAARNEGPEDQPQNKSEWMNVNWALISRSFTSERQLAAIRKVQNSNGSQVSSKSKALLLHYASANPSASIEVAKAVASPAAVRCKDANGRLPLHWAAMHSNSVEMLNYLLVEWPGATKVQDKDGYTPLHRMVARDSFPERAAMIERLIDADPASCSRVTVGGRTALHLFCGWAGDDVNACRSLSKLLAANPSAASHQDRAGNVPLHVLCCRFLCGENCMMMLLAAYKEGAAIMNSGGFLPVHNAVVKGFKEAVVILLDVYPEALSRGANTRENILTISATRESTDIFVYILQRNPELAAISDSSGKFPLHEAAESDDLDRVKILYAAYPEAVLAYTDEGLVPLHCSLRYATNDTLNEETEIVRFLTRQCPEAVNMRRLPEEEDDGDDEQEFDDDGDGDGDGDNDQEVDDDGDDDQELESGDDDEVVGDYDYNVLERPPVKLTPYQVSRCRKLHYISRILLRACPAADPKRLRKLNYKARRQLMFLAFAARTDFLYSSSSTGTGSGTGRQSTSAQGNKFIYQLRKLMNIGEEMGLLRHIASYL